MTKAIIYARVSTDRQRDVNVSIQDQINQCFQYIQRKGYQLVGNVLIDKVSGKETDQHNPDAVLAFVDDYSGELYPRPGTNRALDYYDNFGGFDVLVCKHRDRYTRSAQATYNMDYDFTDMRGIKIEFVDGFQNDDTPEGNLTAGFIDLMSEYENIRRAKRGKDGKLHYAKEKQKLRSGGRSSYGYTFDKESLGGLKIIPAQAEVVKTIFSLYTKENYSIRAIAKYLNEKNIPAYLNGQWGKSSILKVLSNKNYSGTATYNRTRRIKNRITQHISIKQRDPKEWIEFPCPAIVDQATFETAQATIENNRDYVRNTAKRFYLLSGRIFCESCGKPYFGQTVEPSDRNRLSIESQQYRHRIKNGHCTNHTISARKIEPFVWESIETILLDPIALKEGFDSARERALKENSNYAEQQTHHKKELDRLENILKNLTNAYIDPDIGISKDEFISQRIVISNKINDEKAKLKDIESHLANIPTPETYKSLEKFSTQIRKRLTDPTFEPSQTSKRKIIEIMQIKVSIDPAPEGKIRLSGTFGEALGLLITMSKCSSQKPLIFIEINFLKD